MKQNQNKKSSLLNPKGWLMISTAYQKLWILQNEEQSAADMLPLQRLLLSQSHFNSHIQSFCSGIAVYNRLSWDSIVGSCLGLINKNLTELIYFWLPCLAMLGWNPGELNRHMQAFFPSLLLMAACLRVGTTSGSDFDFSVVMDCNLDWALKVNPFPTKLSPFLLLLSKYFIAATEIKLKCLPSSGVLCLFHVSFIFLLNPSHPVLYYSHTNA